MSAVAQGFVGDRLAEARLARGISATDFADLVGVSVQSISKYENGKTTPKLDVLFRMAEVLKFPRPYFLRPVFVDQERPIFWRGKLTAPPKAKDRARVRLTWMKEMVDYLASYFDFPSLDVPDLGIPDFETVDRDYLEGASRELREHWSVRPGPMPDIVEKIENSGILVSCVHVHAEKLDAFSQWSSRFGIPLMLLSRDKASAARQRFDALHELAHILMHRRVEQRHLNNPATYKILERQADLFASYTLLPEPEFIEELYLPTLDAFLTLKERWGVSVGAMIMRCRDLEILDDSSAQRLWINYNRRGWRKGEPLDGKMEKERPYLIHRSFEMLLSERVQSPDDIKTALPFPPADIEEIADLPPGTLTGEEHGRVDPVLRSITDAKVVSISDRRRH